MEPVCMNGSVHTAQKQHQRVCVRICVRVLCGLDLLLLHLEGISQKCWQASLERRDRKCIPKALVLANSLLSLRRCNAGSSRDPLSWSVAFVQPARYAAPSMITKVCFTCEEKNIKSEQKKNPTSFRERETTPSLFFSCCILMAIRTRKVRIVLFLRRDFADSVLSSWQCDLHWSNGELFGCAAIW